MYVYVYVYIYICIYIYIERERQRVSIYIIYVYIYIYLCYKHINASPWIFGFIVLVSKRTGLERLNPGVKRLDDWRRMMEMRRPGLNIL